MNNIFYNSACILMGTLLIIYPVYRLVKHLFDKKDLIMLLFSIPYLFLGIYGFFIPKDFEMIMIFIMLGLAAISIATLIFIGSLEKMKNMKEE